MSAGETNIAASAAGAPAPPPRAPAVKTRRDVRRGLLLPAVGAVFIVSLIPIAYAVFAAIQTTPNGFEALYADQRFWEAGRRTLLLAAYALPIEIALGLAIAAVFLGRMPGKAVLVSLLVLPALVAPVIGGSAWRMLFDNDYGPVNHILSWLAGGAVMTLWTEDPDFALRAILIADVWQWTPFVAVLIVAAFSSVDRGQLDMAAIDDAGPWRTLFRIVLPAVWPVVALAVIVRGLDLVRLFDVVWTLTKGGPEQGTETLAVVAYERVIDGVEVGAVAALAVLAIVGITVVAAPLLMTLGRAR